MSTSAIRAVLDAVAEEFGEGRVREAMREVEAIEAAARVAARWGFGPLYGVQPPVREDMVAEYEKAEELMAAIARQSEEMKG